MAKPNLELDLQTYLQYRLHEERNIVVNDLQRIHGGASRETYRFKVRYLDNPEKENDRLILRLNPESSLVETEHAHEFQTYRAFFGTEVPVPEPLWLEEDTQWLGQSFFIMREILGCETEPTRIAKPPFLEVREKIGHHYAAILGQIAKFDPVAIGFTDTMETPTPAECWNRELDYWESMIDKEELEPQPVARAGIRWLRRNPPPPAQKVGIVHGDYRIGNFLYGSDGVIRGILDWEMCHLGDPLEDLAYGMNLLWTPNEPGMVGQMIARDKCVFLWEAASGLKAGPEALRWWEIFSSVKALSIWMSAAGKFNDGSNTDMILAHTGWVATEAQGFILQNQLRNP